ncbi:hypothetical protein AOPFMNJM_1073 [Methylobacterium jeotgali]|uniref:Uncharacterized protein n=1 Tax=Methylobacterium jeotgali TaxID=381630 RepID=A0ABQ4SRM0_9HYPH|nr:hypothetical protein AOPFMNJM_1073 [Methylobacterium jeotgali]
MILAIRKAGFGLAVSSVFATAFTLVAMGY